MNTQPPRHDITDQPWLGAPLQPNPATPGFGLWPSYPPFADQPGLSLAIQPRHQLSCGTLCAAEVSPHTNSRPADPEEAAQLGGSLIETACHEAQDWNAMIGIAITVSVDLPTSVLRQDKLVAHAKRALARSSLVPCRLELQLPAETLMNGDANLLLSLAALRDLGIGLSMDHFGTLPISPRMLQRLPLTAAKLDPTLVRDLVADRTARLTVKAAIALAHSLNATVLATQIQTPTQRDILADLGCNTAQGPIFGGTLRPETFHASLLLPAMR
jgi:EAL domain-containing protein (putative c-di-GMP-specific phosphodiesterase class I)